MTKRYVQAREDYEFLQKHHGNRDATDLSGGFGFENEAYALLENPTKTRAAIIYEDLIIYSFDAGFEASDTDIIEPDLENNQVREIYERHNCL